MVTVWEAECACGATSRAIGRVVGRRRLTLLMAADVEKTGRALLKSTGDSVASRSTRAGTRGPQEVIAVRRVTLPCSINKSGAC